MSQGVGSESGAAVAPAREAVAEGSGRRWARRLLVLAGLLIYFGSFFLTAVKQGNDTASGAFCAYYTFVWPWTDGLDQLHKQALTFLSVMFSGWVNPAFLLICIMPPVAVLRTFANRVLKPLWVILALSCWVVFDLQHVVPTWGYFLWTLGMVMVLFRERALATVFRAKVT